MDLIFAKWIFVSSLQLTAGTGLDWPVMLAATVRPPGIDEVIASEDVWAPPTICQVGDPVCVPSPGGFVAGGPRMMQIFCVARGVYRMDLRLGLKPTGMSEVEGKVWLQGPGAETLLVEFYADPARATFQASSVAIAAEADACYRLRYDATGNAWINPDPRVTSLTIHRAGQ